MDEDSLRRRLAEIERRLAEIDAARHDLATEVARIRVALGAEVAAASAPAAARPSGLTAPASSRRALTLLGGVLLVALAVGGGAFFLFRHGVAERVEGRVSVAGGPLGVFAFEARDCDSGASYVPQFFGADLKGEGRALRVIGSGDDAHIALLQPESRPIVELDRDRCSRWDVQVNWAGLRVNEVPTVSGHLHATCSLPQGGTLQADAEFARCAF